MLTATATRVSGVTAKLAAKVSTSTQMAADTLVNSTLIIKTGKDVKNGQMAHFSRGNL